MNSDNQKQLVVTGLEKFVQVSSTLGEEKKCEKCGGTFFHELNVRQYSATGYGNVPGADISPIDDQVYTVLSCMGCGFTQTPNLSGVQSGRVGRGMIVRFNSSLNAGRKTRSLYTDEEITKCSQDVAGIAYQQMKSEMQAQIAALSAKLDALVAAEAQDSSKKKPGPKKHAQESDTQEPSE